jgi:hypothetical protein
MTTPEKYGHFAEECMQAARRKTEAEQKAFLDMAQALTDSLASALGP